MKTKKKISVLFAVLLTSTAAIYTQIAQEIPQSTLDEIEKNMATETPMQHCAQILRATLANKTSIHNNFSNKLGAETSKNTPFTKTFLKFIKEIYNEADYAQVLAQNETHIIHFLEIATELNLDVETTFVCIRLFYNKLKACEAIDDTMINQMLPRLASHLERFFNDAQGDNKKVSIQIIKKNLESAIINKMTDQLPEFQAHDAFAKSLTSEIVTMIKKEIERTNNEIKQGENRERLRQIIIRLLEIATNKIVWNPKAPDRIWQSFIDLANNLEHCGTRNIIASMDDLDDLFWSLTLRFSFFLDLAGSCLPLEFYEKVEHDLENGTVAFLETPEQDAGITSKKETLTRSLIQAKTKAYAYHKMGLFSLQM